MNVMTTAKGLGLVTDERRDVSGTIDQAAVLAAISELALDHPGSDDLFADAAMRVQLARSAGLVRSEEASVSHRSRNRADVQLRYRSEMAEVFTDLAIDVGLRGSHALAGTSA